MSNQSKPKFKKVKLQEPTIYRWIQEECKKHTPNPRLAKQDQIEKEDIEASLKTKWGTKRFKT